MALLSSGAGDPSAFTLGDLLVLGCALAFTGHILAIARFAPRMDPLTLTFVQVLTAAALTSH